MENAKPPAPSRERRRSDPRIGVVLLTVFLDMVGFSILFPIFPQMLEHYLALEGQASAIGRLAGWLRGFGGDDANAVDALFGGVLGSVYSLLQFLSAPLWGGISDRVGRRPTLLLTLLGTCAGYLLWVFSGSFWLLVVSRLVAGVAAGNISTASAVIADLTEGKDRARGMGLLGMSIGLGFILGPVLCLVAMRLAPGFADLARPGLALNPFSAPALASLALAMLNLLWIATRFRETLPPERRGTSARVHPLNVLAQARRLAFPGLARTNAITFLYYTAFSGMEFTLTFLAAERLVPRIGERRTAAAGLLLLVPGFFLIGAARSDATLYAGVVLMAIGSALSMPSLSSLASRYAPSDRQGLALGTNRSLGSLARAVGPLASSLAYWKIGSGASYHLGALFLLWPILLAVGLPPVPAGEVTES